MKMIAMRAAGIHILSALLTSQQNYCSLERRRSELLLTAALAKAFTLSDESNLPRAETECNASAFV
jgi:hypothetical protein